MNLKKFYNINENFENQIFNKNLNENFLAKKFKKLLENKTNPKI